VIEDLLKNELFLRFLPPVAGVAFVIVFVSLGLWQLDRAGEKNALMDQFEADAPYEQPSDYNTLEEFDRIAAHGQFQGDRQILIDNIPKGGRIGYFVITPFRPARNEPLLLVNRGWVPKTGLADDVADIAVAGDYMTVQGLVGHLPRVAIRPGDAFAVHGDWPRTALYPSLDEIAAELGEEVLPVILLLGPDAAGGFVRNWEPDISGPMTHYSYAFQWFSMATAVVLLVGWHIRKRMQGGRTKT
jgi:surfeit locus 1 family protein